MSKPTPLSARMKGYEQVYRRVLPRRTYTLMRLDGEHFKAYTAGLDKPFDTGFAEDMHTAARALCLHVTNVAFGFVASDEISLLLTDFANHTTQPWRGGVEAKMLSGSASLVTAAFNAARAARGDHRLATFDSRVKTLSDPAEVVNYFLWRQRDTMKNSVSMAASAHFPEGRLHGLTGNERQELLSTEAGVNWDNYPVWARRGAVMTRVREHDTVTYVDRRTQEPGTAEVTRDRWQVLGAPRFTADPSGWLWQNLPLMGTPRPTPTPIDPNTHTGTHTGTDTDTDTGTDTATQEVVS